MSDKKDSKIIMARAYKGEVPPCDKIDDLTSRAFARAIAAVFRDYLAQQNVCAIELMHSYPALRKLEDNSQYKRACLFNLANQQGSNAGPNPAERNKKLDVLWDKCFSMNRDMQAEKQLPRFDDDSVGQLMLRLAARSKPEEVRFRTYWMLTRHMQSMGSLLAKVEYLIKVLTTQPPDLSAVLLDELACSMFDSSGLIMDMLGHRPSLAAALLALAQLANGQLERQSPPNKLLDGMNLLMADKRLPLCGNAIWERVILEIDGVSPLYRLDPRKEWSELMALRDKLQAIVPEAQKEALSKAVFNRRERLRNKEE